MGHILTVFNTKKLFKVTQVNRYTQNNLIKKNTQKIQLIATDLF